jgi:catechol 2,3-dioxygenase-like lactoylglutathione lyase family enzyme
MIPIHHIDHIVLRVIDAQAMMDFYAAVFGCTVERHRPDLGLYHLRAGSALIDLVPVDGPLGKLGGAAPAKEGRNVDHFCLRIEPWDESAIRAHLAALGIPIASEGNRYGADGTGPSFYILDPEGNTVELKGPPELTPH